MQLRINRVSRTCVPSMIITLSWDVKAEGQGNSGTDPSFCHLPHTAARREIGFDAVSRMVMLVFPSLDRSLETQREKRASTKAFLVLSHCCNTCLFRSGESSFPSLHAHTLTHTHGLSHPLPLTHMHRHTHGLLHTQSFIHRRSHTHTHRLTHTTCTHRLSHTQSHTHIDSYTIIHAQRLSHAHTDSHTFSHSTHSHTHSHTHTGTQTPSVSRFPASCSDPSPSLPPLWHHQCRVAGREPAICAGYLVCTEFIDSLGGELISLCPRT